MGKRKRINRVVRNISLLYDVNYNEVANIYCLCDGSISDTKDMVSLFLIRNKSLTKINQL